MNISVIGAGLAGCEAALWLANAGVRVTLYEQKPVKYSPAHTQAAFAELVCSNSFKAERLNSAAGLLKEEMRLLGSSLLPVAECCRVPAGGALAVQRDLFSSRVTQQVYRHENINVCREEVASLPLERPILVATGPLTEPPLAGVIAAATDGAPLSFYDAAAPIVLESSLDREKIFRASRYGRGGEDYLNCPFDKAGYEAFQEALAGAQTAAPHHRVDELAAVYERCMPIETMAKRGADTMRFGPLRPVGLTDPATGRRPWANVQLRCENIEGTMYNLVGFQTNLRFGEQQRVFRMIPGLERAEFVRYGVIHRNTFLNSPAVLRPDFSAKNSGNLFFAGQITGFEGYMESAACGLLAARALLARLRGAAYSPPPPATMCGALNRYITAPNRDFQPMGANMGLLPPLAEEEKDKRNRYQKLAERALDELHRWLLY